MSTTRVEHGLWSSRLAFILAATGAAVGLGNIWKFPYIMGENGGGAFVIVYLFCILAIGIPVMMAEVLIGRRGRLSPANSVKVLSIEAGASNNWKYVGWAALAAGFLILSFYSVIAGWTFSYIFHSISGSFVNVTPEQVSSIFNQVQASPLNLLFWSSFVLIGAGIIVGLGIKNGIEKIVKFAMPLLLILLIIVATYASINGDVYSALDFMFSPDFSKLTYSTVLIALGHAFFSLSLASGAMIIYGAYLPSNVSISRSVITIAVADTVIALIAGLAIFPIVFGNGLEPSHGPGLVFVSLPIAFGQMWGGSFFGTLFFVMLGVASFTTAISMIESAVAWFVEQMEISRMKAAMMTVLLLWLLSLLTVFSFSGAEWTKLDFEFVGKHIGNYFDLIDHFTSDVLLPLGGVFTAVFVAWIMKKSSVQDEIQLSDAVFNIWYFTLRWLTPFAVAFVFLNLIGVINF